MPSSRSAENAAARRTGARGWRRFAAALTVSALLHLAFAEIVAPEPGARSTRRHAAATPSSLAVRLIASDDPLPTASPTRQAAPPKPPLSAPAQRLPSRAVPAARAAATKERQEVSVLSEPEDTRYYAARHLDHYPALLAALDLTFPADVAASERSGYVLLLVLIDVDGRVNDASVVEAVPAGVFDEEARRALLAAHFKPAFKNGRAVRSRLIVHVSYGKHD